MGIDNWDMETHHRESKCGNAGSWEIEQQKKKSNIQIYSDMGRQVQIFLEE